MTSVISAVDEKAIKFAEKMHYSVCMGGPGSYDIK
jgi:hypothetical protein